MLGHPWEATGLEPKGSNKGKGFQAMTEEKPSVANESVSVVMKIAQLKQLHRHLNQSVVTNSSTVTCSLVSKGTALHLQNKNPWIFYSGASDHMTGYPSLFYSYTPCPGNSRVQIADGTYSTIAEKATVCLTDKIALHSVLHFQI